MIGLICAGKILLVILLLSLIFLLAVFVYNRIKLNSEKALFDDPPGHLVEIDGHSMHVYTVGSGEHTLLFLSGSGTASPLLDFKCLYDLLSNDYRIVVIEKFGYGFSDVFDTERSFDTILRQDRKALAKLGIEGPFILCPHSMSGLEAILWAQRFPHEVEAVIGLDMALPRSYDGMDFDKVISGIKLARFGRDLGLTRLYYADSALPAALSKEDKRLYRAIGCKIAVNEIIANEGRAISDAIKEIDNSPLPDVPTLMFVSNGKETGLRNWISSQREYAASLSDAKLIELDCGHYVHWHEPERISREMKEFIEKLG